MFCTKLKNISVKRNTNINERNKLVVAGLKGDIVLKKNVRKMK